MKNDSLLARLREEAGTLQKELQGATSPAERKALLHLLLRCGRSWLPSSVSSSSRATNQLTPEGCPRRGEPTRKRGALVNRTPPAFYLHLDEGTFVQIQRGFVE